MIAAVHARLTATALALLLIASTATAASSRVDGIAALVGGTGAGPGVDVILRSDVELRARLQHLATDLVHPLGPLPSAWLTESLNAMVAERVIAREARRLQVVQATAADVLAERARLVAAAGGPARVQQLFEALGAKPDELDAIARSRALVGAFLSANLEAASIGPGEMERWVQQLRARTPLQIYATW